MTLIIEFFLIGRPALPIDFEAEYHWLIAERSVLWIQIRVGLEKDIREADAKVSPIDVKVLLPGHIDLLAAWAKNFHP